MKYSIKITVILLVFFLCFFSACSQKEGENREKKTAGSDSENKKIDLRLIEESKNYSREEVQQGTTPLHIAAWEGNRAKVEQLLSQGADINERCKFLGETPLHKAVEQGHKETAEFLLSQGADVDPKSITPFIQSGNTPLYAAALSGRLNLVEMLNSYNADINAKNDNGDTPLHAAIFAAGYGSHEVMVYLISKEADVNIQNKDGHTPLHLAVLISSLKAVEHLLKNNADVNIKDAQGKTPLDLADSAKNKDIVDMIKKYQAE